MRLESRLRMLERHHGPGNCPVCMGNGKLVITYVKEHETPPEPEGCPNCGQVHLILVQQARVEKIDW